MEASEAFEHHEHIQHAAHGHGNGHGNGEQAGFATQAAFLAVATFKANEAVKEAIQEQTKVSDTHFQSQTQTSRQIELELNNALLNAISISVPASAAKQLQDAANTLDKTSTQLDPVIKDLDKTASEQSHAVRHQNDQHLLFELAVVGLQIGIVLAGVAIIVKRRWLMYLGGFAGVVGVVVLIAGFAS